MTRERLIVDLIRPKRLLDFDSTAFPVHGYFDMSSFRREFDSVRQQIPYDLLYAIRIDTHDAHIGTEVNNQPYPTSYRKQLHRLDRAFHGANQVSIA